MKEIAKSLKQLTLQIKQYIQPSVDFHLVRKTAAKCFQLSAVTIENTVDFEITEAQALRVLKIFAKAHKVDLATSPLSFYLELNDIPNPEKINAPQLKNETEIFDPLGTLPIGYQKFIDKAGYGEWASFFGRESFCPDFHRDEWACLDWYEQYQLLLKQQLSSSELRALIESCHPEKIGLLKATVLAWIQTQPADLFFARACLMAKKTGILDLEAQMYQSWWDNFELLVTTCLAIIHIEIFQQGYEEHKAPAFIDLVINEGGLARRIAGFSSPAPEV